MIARLTVLLLVAALQGQEPEYAVKAKTLFAVSANVAWPDKTFEKPETPIRVGILGKDRFGNQMDDVVKGKKFSGRPVQIFRESDPQKLLDCQIVFVSDSESEGLDETLKVFQGRPQLLVGDREGFAKRGVGINLLLETSADGSQTIFFELNLEALERSGLTPNSKILKLGRKPK